MAPDENFLINFMGANMKSSEWLKHTEIIQAKSREVINITCHFCNASFKTTKHHLQTNVKFKKDPICFCSPKCKNIFTAKRKYICCATCNTAVIKRNSELRKVNFCSSSCAAKYHNAHKTKGSKRSKLEAWLEIQLYKQYPNLLFVFNGKEKIKSELDIYIPSLKLAFELNGIFHYEPIYGKEKLKSIQNNDTRKFQACLEHDIELCIIDTSQQKRFTEQSSMKYLDIIKAIIDLHDI